MRPCAALIALWLVACGVLAMRHQAEVRHVRDPHSGALYHAAVIEGHHVGDDRDVHGRRDRGDDHEICELGSWHQPGVPTTVRVELGHDCMPAVASVTAPRQRAIAVRPVFRLAPKTSPPTA